MAMHCKVLFSSETVETERSAKQSHYIYMTPVRESRSGTTKKVTFHQCDLYQYEIVECYDINKYRDTKRYWDKIVPDWRFENHNGDM